MLDWRGQGLSERRPAHSLKGHVRDFAEYDTDIESFMREVVLPDCPPPVFAIGHSMGGAVLLRAARRGRRWFDRIVLSAPMIELRHPRLQLAKAVVQALHAVRLRRLYVPGGNSAPVTSLPFAGNPLTSDPVRYARTGAIVAAEPKLALASPSIAWMHAAFRAMKEFAEPSFPSSIRQPVLIVGAGQDEIVATPAVEQFAMRMRGGGHLVVAGARHELMMEQDRYREQFFAAFDAFVPGTPVFA
jgi:lysophospholipase